MGSFWVEFGIIVGLFWDKFGRFFGPFWDDVGIILGLFWAPIFSPTVGHEPVRGSRFGARTANLGILGAGIAEDKKC